MLNSSIRILFLSNGYEDYLRMSLLHGLRQLHQVECVDFPKLTDCYIPEDPGYLHTRRGHGFSLFGLLPDSEALQQKRLRWESEIGQYDVIIISDIAALWHRLTFIRQRLKPGAAIGIIDGSDPPALFPYEAIWGNIKQNPLAFFTSFKKIKWYKREWMPGKSAGTLAKLLPDFVCRLMERGYEPRPVSYSFPAEKISKPGLVVKTKEFNFQIVDKEVADRIGKDAVHNPLRSDAYVFKTEEAFYGDFRASRFGITTKRAGWDCLRHYEIAANGCVICFRDLHLKPEECAPHGLNRQNCIMYTDAGDLFRQTGALTEAEYAALQKKSYAWIQSKTTENVAAALLDDLLNAP